MAFDQAAKNKVILLYILDTMDVPLQENVFLEIMIENEWVPYMDCKASLAELIRAGLVANISTRTNLPRYAITSDGRECLNHFFHTIPTSLREEIAENIKNNRISYRKKQDYFSDYYKNTDGTYTVVLRIETATVSLMELKLNIQSRTTAKWIFKNWSEKAPVIYEFIHEQLVE